MAIVRSYSTLADAAGYESVGWGALYPGGGRSVAMYDGHLQDYAVIYATQLQVRICVDFRARNVAQLTFAAFRKLSPADRRKIDPDEHPLAFLLNRPTPWTTHYRFIRGLMVDRDVYDRALFVKVYPDGSDSPRGLVRIRPQDFRVIGGLWPTAYEVTFRGRKMVAPPSDVIHFRGHNPEDPNDGLSPMEALRRLLAEEDAAARHREHMWRRGARMGGIVERPADAPEWTKSARDSFREDFSALYAGENGAGHTAVLEEGMTFRQLQFSAEASQYLEARKLNREEAARMWHIPAPMVGLLDHATLSNTREMHKMLYQDCLGPDLEEIQQEFGLQLVPDFPDAVGVYIEANIREKMRGSFEEEASALSTAIGAPWLTRAEGRAMWNLRELDGADQLIVPLNVLEGGQASPQDGGDGRPADPAKAFAELLAKAILGVLPREQRALPPGKAARRGVIDPTLPKARERHAEKWAQVVRRHFDRQQREVNRILNSKAAAPVELVEAIEAGHWNEELARDLLALNTATAGAWSKHIAKELDVYVDPDRMQAWLAKHAQVAAEQVNAATAGAVTAAAGVGRADQAGVDTDALANVFTVALGARALQIAREGVRTAANFGAHDAAEQAGVRWKRWQVNSTNPRSAHRALNGARVPLGDVFPNGMRWPGDPAGGAANLAECQCSVVFDNADDY